MGLPVLATYAVEKEPQRVSKYAPDSERVIEAIYERN
jgi:hypothetical protein